MTDEERMINQLKAGDTKAAHKLLQRILKMKAAKKIASVLKEQAK